MSKEIEKRMKLKMYIGIILEYMVVLLTLILYFNQSKIYNNTYYSSIGEALADGLKDIFLMFLVFLVAYLIPQVLLILDLLENYNNIFTSFKKKLLIAIIILPTIIMVISYILSLL